MTKKTGNKIASIWETILKILSGWKREGVVDREGEGARMWEIERETEREREKERERERERGREGGELEGKYSW